MRKRNTSKQNKLSTTFQRLDLFGQNVSFSENGQDAFTTHFGACISMVIIILVLAYGFDKLEILRSYGDSNLTEYIEEQYNSHTVDVDYATSNFNFAF